jgi:hypothetical protein
MLLEGLARKLNPSDQQRFLCKVFPTLLASRAIAGEYLQAIEVLTFKDAAAMWHGNCNQSCSLSLPFAQLVVL